MLSETEICDRLSKVLNADAGLWALHPEHRPDETVTISWTRNEHDHGTSLTIQATDGEDPARGQSRSVSILGDRLVMDARIFPSEKSRSGKIDADLFIAYSIDQHGRHSEEYNESMGYIETLLEILEAAE